MKGRDVPEFIVLVYSLYCIIVSDSVTNENPVPFNYFQLTTGIGGSVLREYIEIGRLLRVKLQFLMLSLQRRRCEK